MGNIIRQEKTYPLDSPPEIKFTCMTFTHTGQKFSQGDVFSRPTSLVFRHFGVVYGLDENNTLWLLELNQDGVYFVTMVDFMAKYRNFRTEIEFPKLAWEIIYKRANERKEYPYSFSENNCEAFVRFLFFEDATSRQSNVTKVFAEVALDILFEIGFQGTPSEKYEEAKKKHATFKKEIKLDKLGEKGNLSY